MFYFLGFGPIVQILDEKGNVALKLVCDTPNPESIEEALLCEDPNVVLGSALAWILLAGGLAALITGFSAIYVIPIILLLAFLNFFIFPLGFVFGGTDVVPDILKTPIIAFFNVLTVLAVTNFIRGGGT
jgi:hypothetical protein